jgi:hypothetical protein
MREWIFGLYASQHDAISFQNLGWGHSIVGEGSTTNEEQTLFYVDSDVHSWAVHPSANTDFTYGAVNIEKELLKAKLGQIPILVKVLFSTIHKGSAYASAALEIYRFIAGRTPTKGDASNRYRDRTGLVTWYEDAYAPIRGRDIEDPASYIWGPASIDNGNWQHVEVTSIIERALRDNVDVDFLVRATGTGGGYYSTTYSNVGEYPYFSFYYFYPIEFYQDDGAGEIDLTSVVDDLPGNEYYLGAVERDQTSTPIKGHFRNYTDATQQVEIFDDHPENEQPVQRVGTGTGELDYCVLSDNAVSQLYTAIFYSSTQFEIKAEAYRDNATSLHPQINADAQWRGDTSTDFTAPSGGFSIPAAAWQKTGILSGDEFEIGVRGNTTVTDWPADSNDQVEMTFDDAGSPDADEWRPVTGRRIKSSASVTIDATTKFIPTNYVLPSDWPVGNKAFIHNADDYDAGQIKSVQEAALGAVDSTNVAGLDDMSRSGNYNGNANNVYRIQIDATGTPDTFSWSRDGSTTWIQTGVSITGSPQLLENGVWITFAATTGHTLADYWTVDADTWGIELEGLTSGSTVYAPGSIVATTLPFRDVLPAVFSQIDAASGASETPPSRVYLASTAGFTQGDTILVSQAGGSGNSETATIATGGVQTDYLDLTAALVNDYESGDFCTKADSGQTPFWLRVVATSTTVEELKTLRLNARIL